MARRSTLARASITVAACVAPLDVTAAAFAQPMTPTSPSGASGEQGEDRNAGLLGTDADEGDVDDDTDDSWGREQKPETDGSDARATALAARLWPMDGKFNSRRRKTGSPC